MLFKVNVSFKFQLPIIYISENHADISSSCPQGKVYTEVTERPSLWMLCLLMAYLGFFLRGGSTHCLDISAEWPRNTCSNSWEKFEPFTSSLPQRRKTTKWTSNTVDVWQTDPCHNYTPKLELPPIDNSSSPRLGFLRYVSLSLNERKWLGG